MPTLTRRRPVERARIARIARQLRRRNLTVYEVMALEATDRKQAWSCLRYLRGEMDSPRRVRIVGWSRDNMGPAMAIYGRGTAPDEASPPPLTREETLRRKSLSRRADYAATVKERRAEKAAALVALAREATGTHLVHPRRPADDEVEAQFDALMAGRAATIQPRRDAMITALFGAP